MKFGIFLLLQSPEMRPSQETYDNALAQGVMADQLGFDYIVAAEHHFSSYGFLPAPLVLIPVLAERTKQIRFSTAVVVLPLRNPIQLAEEIAMLDVVTRGRVEVGFGTGYQQYEFQRFGVNLAENRAMFEEGLELLTKLLSTENVSHQGQYWQLPETTILPRPITKPHPQFWRATSSVPTMAWSLARGIKVITGGTSSSMDRIINNWHLFQDAVDLAGVSWPQEFILQRGVYVSDSEEDAKSMLPHAVWHTRTARGLSANALPVNAGRAMTELTTRVAQEDDPDFLYKDWFFGTPEIVAEKIYRMTQYVGTGYLNCTFNLGQIPHHKIMRSMELFATKVMPHFRDYVPDQARYPRRENAPDLQGYFAWEEGMPLTFG
ncbi:MAG: LLM class flavin-dependent oxidoreductase [Candidatus Tectomicrobia bacterium]|uniref:LLM class flavin-dependent oxidoreductase n=1 Tax=Tectimicrobiota bacterium TaxID=2528274 RepID=A0A937VXC5_UNCTE|nr:LLM class flavin-dependent oxidoreductase [Candidatus Tectomicrobia bacterium]